MMPRCAVALGAAVLLLSASDLPRIERVRADLKFLSSDALQGRLSLDRGADVAAQYIAAEFEKAGLKPVNGDSFLQPFTLIAYHANLPAERLELIRNGKSKAFRPRTDFTGGFVRNVTIQAPLVFAGYGITAPEYNYDDYAKLDVRGKVVLMLDHEPLEQSEGHNVHGARSTKLVNAQQQGAVAVLIVNDRQTRTFPPTPARGTAPPQALEGWIDIPSFSLNDEAAKELLALKGDGKAEIRMVTENSSVHTGTSYNVAGLIEGSDPLLRSETILMTAHYDHLGTRDGAVYPGANDNASGTAGVIELARMFGSGAAKPKRSLLFVVFGSEEEGMLGSHYYCNHPLRPLAGTRAVINLDMIGRDEAHIPQSEGVVQIPQDTSNELNLVGTFYSPDLRKIIERENADVGLLLDTKFDRDRDMNALFRCDHFPFLVHHVPAVWFFGGWHPGYHEPSDTVDKLNFPKMEKVIRLAARSATALANAIAMPRFH